jgi:hypothetical protein
VFRFTLEFMLDATTPCAVAIFFGVVVHEEDGLLRLVRSPASYATYRTVLPASMKQRYSQAELGDGCLDVSLFAPSFLFPPGRPTDVTGYPIMIVLESVGTSACVRVCACVRVFLCVYRVVYNFVARACGIGYRHTWPPIASHARADESELGHRSRIDMSPAGVDFGARRDARMQVTFATLTPARAGGLPGIAIVGQKLQVRCCVRVGGWVGGWVAAV